jgi:hypothetical protein
MLIDSYVPLFTSRLHYSEAASQLSENIAIFAVCRIYTCVMGKESQVEPWGSGAPFIYKLYRVGARTEPCDKLASYGDSEFSVG